MSKMSDIHDSATCVADHGQPCGECRRERDREWRCDACGHDGYYRFSNTGTCAADVDTVGGGKEPCCCPCSFPVSDPFPLESPPLRSLAEVAGETLEFASELDPQTTAWMGASDQWLVDPDPIDHGPVSPELLALGHALIIQPFDDEWDAADERFRRDRHAAFHWWLAGARAERDEEKLG